MKKNKEKQADIMEMRIPNELFFPSILKLLEEKHTVTILARGNSMRPFIESDRDKIVLKSLDSPKVGDPILAEVSPGHYILHRIVRMNEHEVWLMGDGNNSMEFCRPQDLRASVLGFYRRGSDKFIATDSLKWRVYSKVWMTLHPVRRYLLAFYRRIWIPLFGAV